MRIVFKVQPKTFIDSLQSALLDLFKRKEQGSSATVNREHQALSDFVGGETNGRFRFVSALGRVAGGTVGQAKSCSNWAPCLNY